MHWQQQIQQQTLAKVSTEQQADQVTLENAAIQQWQTSRSHPLNKAPFADSPLFVSAFAVHRLHPLLTQMIVEAPEQQVALGSDIIRQLMGQRVNTMPNRIFVYSTRTINNPKGEPFTAVSTAYNM